MAAGLDDRCCSEDARLLRDKSEIAGKKLIARFRQEATTNCKVPDSRLCRFDGKTLTTRSACPTAFEASEILFWVMCLCTILQDQKTNLSCAALRSPGTRGRHYLLHLDKKLVVTCNYSEDQIL